MIDEIYDCRFNALEVPRPSDEWEKLCKEFEDTLTEEQRTAFRDLCDIQSFTAACEMRATYKLGFKDDVTLMKEVQE